MIEKNNFNEIEGKEILNKLFNKELNSKKNILEAIEIIRPLAKEELKGEKLQEIYNIIYNSIEDMNTIVKANTIMYLKNQLKKSATKHSFLVTAAASARTASTSNFDNWFKR